MNEINPQNISGVGNEPIQGMLIKPTKEQSVGAPVEEKKPAIVESDGEKTQTPRGYSLSDVVLKFMVDKETNDLTVFVVDKVSKRVLRSIPPDELNKLDSGQLLEILA